MTAHRKVHGLGSADDHGVATLSALNALISDATLDDASSPRTPSSHASSHQNGGGDEISVAGLSGLLADPQTPTTHASSHATAGADPVSPASIGASPNPHTIEGSNHNLGILLASTLFGKNSGGTAAAIPFAKAATGDTVAQRESDGRIKGATPVDTGDLTTKQYVDDTFSSSRLVQNPVEVWKVKDDADQGGVGTPTPTENGEAWVVVGWGGAGAVYLNTPDSPADGDIAQWNGSGWNRVVQGSGGEVPANTRFVVIGTVGDGSAAGSFLNHEAEIGTADGLGVYSFETPSDGWQVTIDNSQAYKAYAIIVYNAVLQTWAIIQAAVQAHNSSTGIQGGDIGADEAYHLTLIEHTSLTGALTEIDHLGPIVTSADPSGLPTTAELAAAWGGEDWGIAIGLLGEIFVCFLNAAKDQGYAVGMGPLL